MASLMDKIADRRRREKSGGEGKRVVRGPGGQLQEMSEEEVQTVAGKLGRQVPTTPLGGQAMGLSPDQAKMLGDGRQKAAALQLGLGGESEVSREERRDQARTEATEAEAGRIEKSENLQALGSVGDQVHKLITSKFEEMGGDDTDMDIQIDPEAAPHIQAIQARFNEGATDYSAEITAALNAGISLEDIKAALPADASAAVAQSTINYGDVSVDKMLPDLGYTAAELAGLLGLPEGDLTGLTVAQLQDAVDATIAEDLNNVEELQRMLADPSVPAALQAEARETLADLGATGIRFAEQEAEELAEEVRRGDIITVGGKDYTIEELLNDETITEFVGEYLAEKDPEQRQLLAEQNPELAGLYAFAERHQNLLQGATESIGARGGEIVGQRDRRVEIGNTLGKDVMNQLLGKGWDNYGNTQKKLPNNLQHILDPSHEQTADTLDALKFLSDTGNLPSNLTDEALSAMGLDGTPEGMERFREYQTDIEMTNVSNINELAEVLDISAEDLQNNLSSITSNASALYRAEMDRYNQEMKSYKWRKRRYGDRAGPPPKRPSLSDLGLPESDIALLSLFDNDLDGQMDDWSEIDSRMEARLSDGTASARLGALRSNLSGIAADISGVEKRAEGLTDRLQKHKERPLTEEVSKIAAKLPEGLDAIEEIGSSDDIRAQKDEVTNLLRQIDSMPSSYKNTDRPKLVRFVNEANEKLHEHDTNWTEYANDVVNQWRKEWDPKDNIGKTDGWLSYKMYHYPEGSIEYSVAQELRNKLENAWAQDDREGSIFTNFQVPDKPEKIV